MAGRIRVAVLMGGPSSERDVSLASGGAVLRALDPGKYETYRLEITREGRWTPILPAGASTESSLAAAPEAAVEAERALAPVPGGGPAFDVAFLALHGRFGEDGTVQALLDAAGIPYTGSALLASALAMDKQRSKAVVASAGLRVPRGATITARDWQSARPRVVRMLLETPGFPAFVKPCAGGSSIGAGPADGPLALARRLDEIFESHDDRALVEERVVGREVTCAVLGNRGQRLRALPVVEIVPKDATFFDYRAKYEPDATEEICPARLTTQETARVEEAAIAAHAMLGCDGMSRSDFILDGGEPVYLETNTIPGMTATSLCPKAAKAVGIDFPRLVSMLVEMALDRARARPRPEVVRSKALA